ncbi:hypothetical protein ABB37_09340 [Leptomonas pyrrhocoris]|uniref:Abscisic acid G-protein coupled receptor-like domain-containing protein n=1 Tax=Leptomonas pyrrhocoris TaxID=157538 RepID=A0A0N0DRF0_LEPPY|nr:hypothetical protein ABB37_09340 [Leptomonas pyrrhocoris]KPA74361.1 hypothetical protein ABB37_09340 [Leptomonas pyrrhocoris]|eukprot:XP_015652800.1 hypothetical protein ABB37_09340 [Leptomonas pyrrhocoris]
MGLLFLLANYAVFYHVGQLLMRLVVVQPVGDGSVVRWCFASTFALSLSLFGAVLADMAHASFFAASSAAVMPLGSVPPLLQRLRGVVEVEAGEFTFVLLCLLATVLLVCPGVVALSFVRGVFRRGGGGGAGAPAGRSRQRRPTRRSSSMASEKERGSSGFSSDAGRTSRLRGWRCGCGVRTALLFVVVLLLLWGGYRASRTGQLGIQHAGQRVVDVGRAVYRQLQTRTALIRVPHEIERSKPAESDGAAADGTAGHFIEPPNPREAAATAAAEEDWLFGFATPQAAATPLDLSGVVCVVTSRVAVVGVALIGLLAGYAAITSPCLFLAPYTSYRGREEELRKAQRSFTKKLCYVLSSCGNAQRQIAALQYGVLHEEWVSPAFIGAASASLDVPPATSIAGTHPYNTYGASDSSLALPSPPTPQHHHQQEQHQFVGAPSSAARYPPPPTQHRPNPGKLLDATPTAAAAAAAATTSSTGAVGWLQRTLTSAATAVTTGIAGRALDSPAAGGSSTMSPAMSRQRAVTRIKKLREEAKGARFLGLALYLQLNEVDAMLRDAQRGGTWVGRWYAGLGVAMACYSAVKIALTGASLWWFKASTQDPVTRAVTLLEDAFILRRRDHLSSPSFSVTAVEVSTHVILALALLVNAWMVISSIRGALLALFHVTMSFSGSAISRPETVAVGLSMLIGVYFVGQLVLLRSSLPGSSPWQTKEIGGPTESTRGGANVLLQVLGTLPYYYYQRLNDWCFLVGCLGAVIVRRFVLRNALSLVVYAASGGEER